MRQVFRLTRQLKVGMEGRDVKQLQNWMNLINMAYSFSKIFPNGVPENGKFQTFLLNVYYHECLDWLGYPPNHVYDQNIHEDFCLNVNMALRYMGDNITYWSTK